MRKFHILLKVAMLLNHLDSQNPHLSVFHWGEEGLGSQQGILLLHFPDESN